MDDLDRFNWSRMRRTLKSWFAKAGRKELPWRQTKDPYRIWISEIMLQQTTVATVGPYYERFLNAFPTVQALAAADQNEVLRLWEGLGYYSRARNIHKAANYITEELQGKFPQDLNELLKLPGIGRYTAGAIASFAFGTAAPIVEANTLRLYSRLLGYEGDPRSKEGQVLLWSFAEKILPRKEPGAFNLALMDLGAMVCTPKEPACPRCPLKQDCRALAVNKQQFIPVKAQKPKITYTVDVAVAWKADENFALKQYAQGERWAGLWDFPRFSLEPFMEQYGINGHLDLKKFNLLNELKDWISLELSQRYGAETELEEILTEIKHSVTRYRIQLLCFQGRSMSEPAQKPKEEAPLTWVRPEGFEDYAFSTTGRKIATLLLQKEG